MVVLVDVDVSFNSDHHGVGKACDHDGIPLAQNADLRGHFHGTCWKVNGYMGMDIMIKKHGKPIGQQECHYSHEFSNDFVLVVFLSFTLFEQHHVVHVVFRCLETPGVLRKDHLMHPDDVPRSHRSQGGEDLG